MVDPTDRSDTGGRGRSIPPGRWSAGRHNRVTMAPASYQLPSRLETTPSAPTWGTASRSCRPSPTMCATYMTRSRPAQHFLPTSTGQPGSGAGRRPAGAPRASRSRRPEEFEIVAPRSSGAATSPSMTNSCPVVTSWLRLAFREPRSSHAERVTTRVRTICCFCGAIFWIFGLAGHQANRRDRTRKPWY